jgi:flagellar FliL protein
LLLLFSRQDASALATDDGKQKLVDAIKQTLATRCKRPT